MDRNKRRKGEVCDYCYLNRIKWGEHIARYRRPQGFDPVPFDLAACICDSYVYCFDKNCLYYGKQTIAEGA